jgi:hypothetical protein
MGNPIQINGELYQIRGIEHTGPYGKIKDNTNIGILVRKL